MIRKLLDLGLLSLVRTTSYSTSSTSLKFILGLAVVAQDVQQKSGREIQRKARQIPVAL